MKLIRFITITFFVFLTTQIQAQINQQIPNAGNVNWQSQMIRATGIGAPNPNVPMAAQRAGAIRAAELDALRQMLETVKGMSISSETTVRNAMIENDVIQTSVSGAVKNFKKTDIRYLSDGSVEVDVEIPLSGILLNQLLPQNTGSQKPGNINYSEQPKASFTGGVVTGLIIDARGLGLRPAIAPKIIDESGNEVYGTGFVSRDYAVQIGVVGYEKDIVRAQSDDRVKGSPAIVKALRVEGTNKTDVIISNMDAAGIQYSAQSQNFMEQCKVMFILD